MKKLTLVFTSTDFASYTKSTMGMLCKVLLRIPYLVLVGIVSTTCWLAKCIVKFCKENTKVAVIIGFILCFMLMFVEFIYFKLQLAKSSYQISELIKRNYELEQTDRYDIGFHDAMAKNREMLTQKIEP
nr:MAG TPA: hypothetical protein [Caudoviricetes sp.]